MAQQAETDFVAMSSTPPDSTSPFALAEESTAAPTGPATPPPLPVHHRFDFDIRMPSPSHSPPSMFSAHNARAATSAALSLSSRFLLSLGEDVASTEEHTDTLGFDPALFVTPPDRFLLCAICTNVCEQPAEASCGHLFCRPHITRWVQSNGTCPVDRKTIHLKDDVHILYSDRIADLRMRCK